jgi:hypothetical protein
MGPLPSRRLLLSAAVGGAALAAIPAMPAAAGTPKASPAVAFNVLDHGAVGDGVTDDSRAINALIRRLGDEDGGVVEFPRGVYLVGSPIVLRSGVHLVSATSGRGYIATHRRVTNVVLVAGPRLSGWVVDSPDGSLVAAGISGIDVQGNGASGGIRLRNAAWCGIERSHINGCGGAGILVQAGMASVFEDVLITNCVLDRSRSAVTGAFDLAGTDHYVSRCEFTASLTGATGSGRIVAAAIRGANHFISDSVGETSDVGFWISADATRFSNVRADTNFGHGFTVGGYGNVFASCSSVGNSQKGRGAADGWYVSGGGNSFAACNVVGGGNRMRHGFNDAVNNRSTAARNSYVGCIVDGATAGRWKTQGFLGSSPAVDTHAVRPVSGTTRIDVSQAGIVVLFDYTRATVVRDFTGGVNGQTIRLLGSPKVTLAPSHGLVTATGKRLKLRRGRTYTFTRYDGVWYQST